MNLDKPSAIAALWNAKRQELSASRSRISLARRWLSHRVMPVVPEEWTSAMGEVDIAVQLPYAVTMPLHTVQVMGRKRPQLRRTPVGGRGGSAALGLAPQKRASQIERWSNEGLVLAEKQGGPLWLPMIGGLFNHGELAVLAYPAAAHWEKFPDYMEDVESDEKDDDGQPLKKRQVKRRYQRDADGYGQDDDPYRDSDKAFEMDAGKSQKAFEDHERDWKSQRLPVVGRVVTAEQCIPLFGPGMRLDGLLVRSTYTEDALAAQGFSWETSKGKGSGAFDRVRRFLSSGRSEDGNIPASSFGKTCTLTELHVPGGVAYYVGDPTGGTLYEATLLKDDEACIDMAAEYGIERLCAKYLYGAHWAEEEDPNYRGVPFLWPFLSSFQGAQNLMTAKMAHAYRFAFSGVAITPDSDTPRELVMENGRPRRITVPAMSATVVGGKVSQLVQPTVSGDVDEIMSVLLGAAKEEGPQSGAFGGAGPSSGHDRSLLRAHLEDAYNLVLEGGREGWEFLGSAFLESGTKVAEIKGVSVPVYVDRQLKSGKKREYLEMTEDLCEGNYELEAYYPPSKGENLPFAQQVADFADRGYATWREVREIGMGDESPEDTRVEIEADKFLLGTEEGRAILNEQVAQYLKDDRMAEAFRLKQQGKMTEDGTPTQAMEGVQKAPPLAGLPSGQSAAASALGGQVAGAMGTAALTQDAAATAV